jgi:hypothetical protein
VQLYIGLDNLTYKKTKKIQCNESQCCVKKQEIGLVVNTTSCSPKVMAFKYGGGGILHVFKCGEKYHIYIYKSITTSKDKLSLSKISIGAIF